MIKNKGFTLIELIIFIIVLGIVGAAISTTIVFALRYTPIAHKQTMATTTASKCMEYYLGQRYLNGFSSIACPAPSTPAFCNTPASDFTTSVVVSCVTFNGDPNYKLIKVTTSANNPPSGKAVLNMLIADY